MSGIMPNSEYVVARDVHGGQHRVRKSDLSFRISTYGVVLQEDTVLLVPQWEGYDIPGGSIERGETIEDALTREVFEETGITVEPDNEALLYITHDFFVHPTDGKSYHYILLYYGCRFVGGTLSDENLQDDERQYAKVARWVPLDEIGSLRFYNPVDSVAIINKALQRRTLR
jgi:ADP-ribose pyrophosphatase YjhB (NUDIX family)